MHATVATFSKADRASFVPRRVIATSEIAGAEPLAAGALIGVAPPHLAPLVRSWNRANLHWQLPHLTRGLSAIAAFAFGVNAAPGNGAVAEKGKGAA